MKGFFRSLSTQIRLFTLRFGGPLLRLYYRQFWSPKPESLEARLHDLARSRKELFFLQIGANDGFQNDPICKFVKGWNWNGICLEPQPLAYHTLHKLYQRDAVKPIQAALAEQDGTLPLYQLGFSSQRWASGLSSFVKEHLEQQIASGYVEVKCRKYGITPPEDPSTWLRTIEVPTVSFQSLLDAHSVTSINLLHIDTEGFDYEVIKLFPFDQMSPEVILLEEAHLSEQDREALQQKLVELGYQLKHFGVDLWAQKG